MIIEVNYTLGFIKHHGLQNDYLVVDNHNWYWIRTEEVANELWFNVYFNPDYQYVGLEYCYSSNNLKDCLDYCGIMYYDGEHYC